MAVWFSGNIVELINEVIVRQAGLVLRGVGRYNKYWQWL